MTENPTSEEKRTKDPYLDRRVEEDRREVYTVDHFLNGGHERRSFKERRTLRERRGGCTRVSKWSSICTNSPKPKEKIRLKSSTP